MTEIRMNNHQEQCVSNFEAMISPWMKAYQCATISYVGLKTAEGPRLLIGRILLEPTRSGVNEAVFRLETEHLIAARFISSATPTDIKTFLEIARGGEIQTIDDTSRLLLQVDGDLSAYFSPIHHPFVSEGPRLPTLRVSGTSRHNLTVTVTDQKLLDWELKAAETPFDNLDELLNQCNLPTQVQIGDSTTLEIVAKSPVTISDASIITGSEAIIVCRLAAELDVAKLRLGYKVLQKNAVDRRSVDGATRSWSQEGNIKVGTYRITVGDAALVQAFVSYAGISHHQWWVTDPQKRLNPRYAIHQVFDYDLEILKRMLLKPESDKSQMFETAVSTLLSLLGFSVSNYGRAPKLQEGPDIIAVAPSGNTAVVECTIGLLDRNDKLAKLVQRSAVIRKQLDQTGYGSLEVQSVIVTPLSREEVTADLEAAGKHEIAVVCREELEGMLRQVSLPLTADQRFQESKSLIPNAGQEGFF